VICPFFVGVYYNVICASDVVVLATGGYLAFVVSLCGHGGSYVSNVILPRDVYANFVRAGLGGEYCILVQSWVFIIERIGRWI